MDRRLPNFGSAARLLIVSLCLLTHPVYAQTEAPAATDGAVTRAPASELPATSDILIRMQSGELVPLQNLLGPDIAESLLQRGLEQRAVPASTIAHCEISGSVSRDVVRLSFRLQIQVRADGEWIPIPVSFGDVFLTEFQHESQVPGAEAVLSAGEQNAKTWHLKGRGLHTLTLQMITRARPVAGGGWQLNLTLPRATASHARLDFSVPVDLQRLPPDAVAETHRDEAGIRAVEMWGLSGPASMSWSEIAPQIAITPVVQSQTRIKLDLTTIPASLNGTQSLQISGGSLSEVSVVYPPGFELQEVSARNSANASVLKNFELFPSETPPRTLIRLTSAVEGQLSLGFELELKERVFPQSIRVSLPLIQEANVQTGDLDILIPSGLVVEQSKVEGAQRRRVTSDVSENVAATAFRLRSPESHILLEVKETEAQYIFDEVLELKPENNSVSLLMRWNVNVLRGSLLELPVQWPQPMRDVWGLLPGDLSLRRQAGSSAALLREVDGQPDLLTLAFPERQTGRFTVELRCLARQEAIADTVLSLLCPQILARTGQPVILRLQQSDQIRIEVTAPASADALTPMSSEPTTESVPGSKPVRSLLYRNPDQPLLLSLQRQDPVVEADVSAGFSSVDTGIEIRQQIRFFIDNKDLTEVSLFVPDRIQPMVRIPGNREPLRPVIGPSGKWTYRLPQAARGEFFLDVGWIWNSQANSPAVADSVQELPLVIPGDCLIRSIRAQTASWSGLQAADPARWQPVFSQESDAAWQWRSGQPGGVSAAIPALIARNLTLPVRSEKNTGFGDSESPLLILASSELLPGQTITSTIAAWEDVPQSIYFSLENSLQLESVQLGSQVLTTSELARTALQAVPTDDGTAVRWQILPSILEQIPGPAVLLIKCRQITPSGSGFYRRLSLLRPRYSAEEEALPVVWSLKSSPGSHCIPLRTNFETFDHGITAALPWSRSLADRHNADLASVISTFPPAVRAAVEPFTAVNLATNNTVGLCLGTATARELYVVEIPLALQVLAIAPGCALIFLAMSAFRKLSPLVPLVLTPAFTLAFWIVQPVWSAVFLPPAVSGILAGLCLALLNRYMTDRRQIIKPLTAAAEMPSIFGFPDLNAADIRTSHAAHSGSNALRPDLSSGSAR